MVLQLKLQVLLLQLKLLFLLFALSRYLLLLSDNFPQLLHHIQVFLAGRPALVLRQEFLVLSFQSAVPLIGRVDKFLKFLVMLLRKFLVLSNFFLEFLLQLFCQITLAVLCLLLNNLDGFVVLLFDLLVFCLQLLDLLNEFVCGLARFFYLLLKRCYLLRHLLLGFFHFLFDDLLLRHLLSLVDPFPLLVVCANESFHIVLELYQLFSVLDQFKLTVLFQLVPHFLRLVLDVLHLHIEFFLLI